MKTAIRLALVASAALALANCSKSPPEATPDEANAGEVVDISNDTLLAPTNMAEPTPTPTPTPSDEPAPSVDEAQQVQDDADATGMTARVSREEAAPANETEAQPAETTEKK